MGKLLFRFFMISLFFLVVSCKNNEEESQKKTEAIVVERAQVTQDKYLVNFSYKECIAMEKKHDTVVIFFESEFNNDLVEVFTNGENKMNASITTDPRLNLAKGLELGLLPDIEELSFRINNGKDIVIKDLKCNFIFVGYFKDSLVEVNFKNKFLGYN